MVERRADRGDRRGRRLLIELGDELRDARLRTGLSQERIAGAAGWTQHRLSEAERGRLVRATVLDVARLASVVGLDLVVRCYPSDRGAVRDVAQVAVLSALRTRIGSAWEWRYEVPVGEPPDQRSFDAVMTCRELTIGVEIETRLRDIQATLRQLHRKQQDADVLRMVLVVPETTRNREAIASARDVLSSAFPVPSRSAVAALARGHDPGGNALLVLAAPVRRRVSRGARPPGTR